MSVFVYNLKKVIEANFYNNNYPIAELPRDRIACDTKNMSIIKKIRIALHLKKINYEKVFNKITKDVSISELEKTYDLLSGDYSKKLFVDIVALRLISEKMSLDIEKDIIWNTFYKIKKDMDSSEVFKTKNGNLYFYDLNYIGYNLMMYYLPIPVFTNFVLKQYEFNKEGIICKAEKNDFVIDGGACFGDTALYFANEVGENGKVFSFEFIPDNIDVFEKNIELNSGRVNNIKLVPHPLWGNSGEELYIITDGPASRVLSERPVGNQAVATVKTIAIDDFVKDNGIEKIDFIKFDIEGAELDALRGAEQTIRKFKPKLAVCLYHDIRHFFTIPDYLRSLNLDYDFYIDHFTPHLGETVLFAK